MADNLYNAAAETSELCWSFDVTVHLKDAPQVTLKRLQTIYNARRAIGGVYTSATKLQTTRNKIQQQLLLLLLLLSHKLISHRQYGAALLQRDWAGFLALPRGSQPFLWIQGAPYQAAESPTVSSELFVC